jgi:hypothetical protein
VLVADRALLDRIAELTDDERTHRSSRSAVPARPDDLLGLRSTNTFCTRGTSMSPCIRRRRFRATRSTQSSTT